MRIIPAPLLLLVLLACAAPAEKLGNGTFFYGGTILVAQGESWRSEDSLWIQGGAVVATGTESELRQRIGSSTREYDLEGAFVIPALVDAHAHLFNLGRLLQRVDLRGAQSLAECLERTQNLEAQLPAGAWLRGRGWDQNLWEGGGWPTHADLDRLFPDRPVALDRVDGHAIWANARAMELAGIDASTPDPPGGEILRDVEGKPIGIFIDDAEALIEDQIPAESAAELDQILRLGAEKAVAHGLGTIHEMGVDAPILAALERAEARKELPLRVVAYLGGMDAFREYGKPPHRPGAAARLRVEGVKLYADGALGSRGAALLEDYSDRPGHRGLFITSPDDLRAALDEISARQFGVAIHAIGDAANRAALDAIEAAWPREDLPRPRIEHAQLIAAADRPRFASLGVIPSMQPTHCTSDMPWAPQRVGDSRRDGLYAWRQLRQLGLILPLGSDFPVESVDPRLGLLAARSRQQPDGTPPGGFDPAERLNAEEALLGFTVWPAMAIGMENWGNLDKGSRADLTILSGDPLGTPALELLDLEVLATMVEGEFVYRAEP